MAKKRVVVLTFDEKKHEASFLMKEKDWRWSLSTSRFDFSMNYSSGIFAEISTEVAPSVTINKDGSFSIDLKKLSYDYRDLWMPIENTLLAGGWSIRGGMLPQWSYRMAIAIPFALLMFMLFYLPLRSVPAVPASSTLKAPTQETAAVDRETYKKNEVAQIAVSGKLMSAENVETILDGLMKMPRQYFGDYAHAFAAYSKVYREKADRKPDFAARLDAFEKENGINAKE